MRAAGGKGNALACGARPHGLVVDRDGEVWITAMGGNRITRLSPATGAFTGYPLQTPDNGPHIPALDGQGNLWFTMHRSPPGPWPSNPER